MAWHTKTKYPGDKVSWTLTIRWTILYCFSDPNCDCQNLKNILYPLAIVSFKCNINNTIRWTILYCFSDPNCDCQN